MNSGEEGLNRLVVARTLQGDFHAIGRVVSYSDHPTITIETPSGERVHWATSLCDVVDLEPEAVDALLRGEGE